MEAENPFSTPQANDPCLRCYFKIRLFLAPGANIIKHLSSLCSNLVLHRSPDDS